MAWGTASCPKFYISPLLSDRQTTPIAAGGGCHGVGHGQLPKGGQDPRPGQPVCHGRQDAAAELGGHGEGEGWLSTVGLGLRSLLNLEPW